MPPPPEAKEVVVSGAAGLGAAVASEAGTADAQLVGVESIRARGYWELVWIRFKRDKVAIASGREGVTGP